MTVTINVRHARRGDLSVELVSPGGIVSYLSTPRLPYDAKTRYVDWEFMSVAHWGEAGEGTWRIIVKDTNVNGRNGTFENWRLNLWDEAIDGANQSLHALPGSSKTQHGFSPSREHCCGGSIVQGRDDDGLVGGGALVSFPSQT